VLRHVAAEGVDQDVDVRQYHLERFMRSTRSRSSSSTPGIGPPVALLIGG
jgi:hypothetical protein